MTILISIITSFIGLMYFIYGKKSAEFSFIIFGVILMSYVYFVQDIIILIFLGIVFTIIPLILKKFM